jgi:hypothetical protein
MTWFPFSVLIEFSLWLSAICIRQPSPHCPSGRREGMCANGMPERIVVFGNRFSCDLRSYLEPAIYGFKSVKRIQELPAHLAHRFRLWSELLAMPNGESDAVHGNPCLVRHFELHGRGLSPRPSLHQFKDLFGEFAFHMFPATPTAATWHRLQPEFYGYGRLAPKTALDDL